MGDEIEEFLLEKVRQKLETAENCTAENRTAKSIVQQLKKSLDPAPSTSAASNVLKLSREKLYNLNNLLTNWEMLSNQNQQTRNPIEWPVLDVKLKRNLAKIKEELRQNQKSVNGQTNQANSAGSETKKETERSTRLVDESKVYGLEHKAMSLQRLLVPSNDDNAQFKAIGIVGMQGIGKTTLCQLIFNQVKVKAHFLPRIWVCMPKQRGDDEDYRKETVKRILACLGVEEETIDSVAKDSDGLKGLLYALRLQLIRKRYLIVLDDIWSTENEYKDFCSCLVDDEKFSEKLGFGSPKGFGGAVIVTSRAEEVAKEMVGEENLHRLEQISDQVICWNIFKDSVDRDGEQFSGQLEKTLKDKMTEKCAGLPLAAKLMGQIAHDKQLLSKKKEKVADESNQEQSPQEQRRPTN